MNSKFILVLGLTFAAVVAFAAPKPEPLWKTAEKVKKELWDKKRCTNPQMVEELEKLRAETRFATNADCRAYLDLQMIGYCRRPSWTAMYRAKWTDEMETRIPELARRSLDDAEVGKERKLQLAAYLAEYLAGEKRYEEAEAVVRKLLPDESASMTLADVYRWQDRFADAWKAIEAVAETNPERAVRKAFPLADADGSEARAMAILERVKGEEKRLKLLGEFRGESDLTRKRMLGFVCSTNNAPQARVAMACRWFGNSSSEDAATAFESLRGLDFTKIRLENSLIGWNLPMSRMFWGANWEKIEKTFDFFAGSTSLKSVQMQQAYVFTLAADGKRDAALKVARENVGREQLKPVDAARFRVMAALLAGEDVEAALKALDLERKDYKAVLLTAARCALNWGLNDEAQKLSADYEGMFVTHPPREVKVAFSSEPIVSVKDWRAIRGRLDCQECDRKFGVREDLLVTDVATGRSAAKASEHESKKVTAGVSAVCDTKGLHIFLQVKDPNARNVENGFANGIMNEMYFAPGRGEPYVCFGGYPRDGAPFGFHTSYDSKWNTRVDIKGVKGKGAFASKTEYSDEDYVQHLFFAWDSFYRKMPADGTRWRFECIVFAPGGAVSLGGSRNVHDSSSWSDLVFSFKPAELAAVRRAAVCRAVRGWRTKDSLDVFERWADPEVGDPAFYAAALKPLEAELAGYAKMVTPEMSDADVELLFAKAMPRWCGLKHEIDALRRDWLRNRCCK